MPFPLLFVMEFDLQNLILLLGISLFILAACGDLKNFQISNKLTISVAILGLIRLFSIGNINSVVWTIGVGSLVLIGGFLLFSKKIIGAGDVKLMTGAILLVGYYHLLMFLLIMSVFGAIMSIIILILHKFPQFVPARPLAVPYGVAIAGSGIITLLSQTSF